MVRADSFEPAKILIKGLTATPTVHLPTPLRLLPVRTSQRIKIATPDQLVARRGALCAVGGKLPATRKGWGLVMKVGWGVLVK
jgi:hypothetical protein